MVRFDWQRFCIDHKIPFVDHGPNTAKGNISVSCPMCGDDPSEHMGLSLDARNPVWGCFRNANHSGRLPWYLVKRLLNISLSQARLLCEAQPQEGAPIDAFEVLVQQLKDEEEAPITQDATPELYAQDAKPLGEYPVNKYKARFLNYLMFRGFDKPFQVAQHYQLEYCLSGRFAHRLIVPFVVGGCRVGFTARSIIGHEVRYLTSANLSKSYLFNCDSCTDAEVVLITEGPLDAMKLDFYSSRFIGIVAVMGLAWTQEQFAALVAITKNKRVVVLFDDDDVGLTGACNLASQLAEHRQGVIAATGVLRKFGVKDPGQLTPPQVTDFLRVCYFLKTTV